jgi:hypothetical protein
MSEELQHRLAQVDRERRFWKRLALLALTVLVLVLLGSASLSGTLYYSLSAEKARLAEREQMEREAAAQARRAAEQAEQTARKVLRQMKQVNRPGDNKK